MSSDKIKAFPVVPVQPRIMADGTLRLPLDFGELPPNELAYLMGTHNKPQNVFFFPSETATLEEISEHTPPPVQHAPTGAKKKKSKSQEYRNVLFRYWEKFHKGGDKYAEFNSFYDYVLDHSINHYKKQLDDGV